MSLPTDTDGDGIYDPTTFNPGGAPGLSAAQLNKIGAGIRQGQVAAKAAGDAAAAAAAGAAPVPTVEVRAVGGRVAQIVETRADGSRNTSTMTYSGDVVTKLVQNNPPKTFTFSYTAGQLTGWGVS